MFLFAYDQRPSVNILFAIYFVILIAVCRIAIREDRRRIWILSAFATSYISVCGMIEVIIWVSQKQSILMDSPLSSMLVEFLEAYLFVDLFYTALWHTAECAILECVLHHIIYIAVMGALKRDGLVYVTQPFWIMEIPSAIRAWQGLEILPQHVADRWFAPTFVACRIVWPAYAMTQLVTRDWVFSFIIVAIAMHCWWAYKNLIR